MANDLELRVAWHRHLGRGRTADAWFDTVTARYRSAGRRYHDIRHLRWVLRHATALLGLHEVADPDAVVAAAFFHDAVHTVDRSQDTATTDEAMSDEAMSAELARCALDELGWSETRRAHVRSLIIATEHRPESAGTADIGTAVLLAADLAVLAADPGPYGDYTRAVRQEYAHLDDDEWRRGRRSVVATFLDRPAIFPVRLGLADWERRARANLSAELAALR
jgi:predicted metal-dependent HD superfamily phosphohydrolase